MVAPQTVRRWILTGSVTAITVSGALYGAELKQSQERAQKRKQLAESGFDGINEQIAQLKAVQQRLEANREEIFRKLEAVKKRQNGEGEGEGNRRSAQ